MRGTFAIAVAILLSCTAIAQNNEKSAELPHAPVGVQEFEHSAFCRKYECFLRTIEPTRFRGDWYYFYNYGVFPANADPEKHRYEMQIGMTLTEDGSRSLPYMLVRWFPIQSAPEKEFPIVRELVREVTRDSKFDAATVLARYSKSLNFQRGPDYEQGPYAVVGGHGLKLSFTRGTDKCRYPQLTLMIE
jgi:hypothetical protein